ncbi:probable sesquiterpene synthase isoform X1 [Arachis ipaensis]|uniref:probable sesquiterpene synthase isoform X1 n=2 Tax=Arachis ipaensis TaxID=130454 RepID=UPI0007AF1985|nr:probable sesquiterpene synthase isoform X1 [Arachis ipaensis]XP_020964651.1 probable sesquiterpene synthase isoform X1 [Arachis ipaensis]
MTSSQPAPSNSKRPSANFAPSIWHDTFQKYADSESLEVNEIMKQEVQMHKEKVKMNLLSNDNNILQRLSLIDSIQRLSISYHFENEIDRILVHIHNDFINKDLAIEECDLHFTALFFRLLRQKGYNISSDVFNKFKNKKGEFDEIIVAQDVERMWSLYEAAQLRVHGEDILEEAHKFTYNKLKSITNQLSPSLANQVNQSLQQPLDKAIPRMKARSYMSFYEENPSCDKVDLLSLAKLDFNMVQKLYKKEIGSNTKWWRELDFATKVPYARDRVVEGFFWPFATNSEPKYSTGRQMITKLAICISLVDDTFDVYGTVEELELFTKAIQRWDIQCIESLPDCFKVIFNAIMECWMEIEVFMNDVGGDSNLVLQHVKQAFSNIVQAYMVEAKWCHEDYIPTYDEYMINGILTSGSPWFTTVFIALGEFASKEMFDWISNIPFILKASSFAGRLTNDLSSHKFEQQRKHVASAVESCMKQYNFSEEEAYEFIKKDINDSWKDMNEEYLKLTEEIPRPILDCIVNLARICEFIYANFEDKYTNCELLNDDIMALLLDPIIV